MLTTGIGLDRPPTWSYFKNRQKNLVDCCVVVVVVVIVMVGPGCCNRESIKHPIGSGVLVHLCSTSSSSSSSKPS